MIFDLTGKVALVTGGGRDIGRAVCLALAGQGADVVINYMGSEAAAADTASAVKALGRRALIVRADVTKKADIERMAAEALAFGNGRIDILVNNAGGLVKRAKLAELTEELLDQVMRLNFNSVVLVCQAVIPHMVKNGGGRVINISSLTKEFASQGINVNSVAPGLIDNNFHAVFTAPDAFKAQIAGIPMGRPGTSEEVAGAVTFLASPAASFINGEVIHVNGGAYFGQ